MGKELKAQTDIAKDQEKLFKDQMNINNKKQKKMRVMKLGVIKIKLVKSLVQY